MYGISTDGPEDTADMSSSRAWYKPSPQLQAGLDRHKPVARPVQPLDRSSDRPLSTAWRQGSDTGSM
eukprot:7160319-Alexandrium_andersonii.AAC.1